MTVMYIFTSNMILQNRINRKFNKLNPRIHNQIPVLTLHFKKNNIKY
jgi:hypothetical protein